MMVRQSAGIVGTMEQICSSGQNSEECFKLLVKMYDHISEHPDQTPDDRAISLKKIIDSEPYSGEPR